MSAAFSRMLNSLKHHVDAMIGTIAQPRWGVVTSFDPVNMLAKVTLQPEGVQTSWIPVLSSWVGNGWGEVTPLAVGQQVHLVHDNGDSGNPVAVSPAYSTANPPPKGPNAILGNPVAAVEGERVFISKAGAVFRLCADGTVYVKADTFIEGNLTVSKEIKDLNGIHNTLDFLRQAYNDHLHGGVTSGGSDTSTTTIAIP